MHYLPMKILFTLIIVCCTSLTLVLGQGAEGFNRFREKIIDFNSGSFVGESGINWDFTLCKNISPTLEGGIEKLKLILKNDPAAEFNSSVISGGVGILKIDYTTLSLTPAKFDVFINRIKVATLNTPASETEVTVSSGDIQVNIDKPFYVRIKQSDETSGQVIIDKVLWSKFSSNELGVLNNEIIPVVSKKTFMTTDFQSDNVSAYHVYPNPAKEFVLIEMAENHNVLFKLFSLAGQMVLQEEVKGSGQKISINNLKEGLYIYKILDEKGKLITGKMIIR
jgi:hypothetical protein